MSYLIATPDPATGTVSIDLEQTIAYDQFGRVAAGGWGSPDFGPAYTAQAPTAQFSVSGGLGRIAVNAVEDTFEVTLDTGQNDHENVLQLATNTAPTGAPVRQGSVVRFTDGNNYFRVAALIAVGGVVSIEMAARAGGTVYTLSTTLTTFNASSGLFLRTRACGNTFSAKLWYSSTVEPTAWTVVETFPGLPTGTRAGAFARRDTGNLTPTTFLFDDSWYGTADGPPVGSPPLRLFRVTPDGVRTEVRGSPFWTTLSEPDGDVAYWTAWDGEAPLDVDLFYEMTSACSTTPVLTSNTFQLDSEGGGWLRDPQVPARNIRIAFDDTMFNDCDDTMRVEWLDWEDRVYRNASGQFDILNAQRPSTVSMRRKRYETTMSFASKTLDDVDAIEEIIVPGTILLLSLPALYGFGRPYGSDYITLQDVAQLPVDTDNYGTPFRSWEVPFMLSPEPVDLNEGMVGSNGIGGGGATYADMTASAIGVTYATTTATGLTYQQLALGVGY